MRAGLPIIVTFEPVTWDRIALLEPHRFFDEGERAEMNFGRFVFCFDGQMETHPRHVPVIELFDFRDGALDGHFCFRIVRAILILPR